MIILILPVVKQKGEGERQIKSKKSDAQNNCSTPVD